MKNVFLAFIIVLQADNAFSQTSYTSAQADSLRKIGDIKEAIECFRFMQKNEGDNFQEFYNYACALSVDNQIDSAFKYLKTAMSRDTSAIAFCDPDFLNLRKDKRWEEFEANSIPLIQKKYNNPFKDIEYAKRLWKMQATDQAYYDCIEIAENRIGRNSIVVSALWELKKKMNDENQKELVQLIETKGWPKKSIVGQRATDAAFLVIQHSDIEKQTKYLPVIEKLCKENEASWENYALMFDRIQTSQRKPQKFGSQVHFDKIKNKYELFPLLDETKVDEWRSEVGLSPLADYVSNWGITFTPKKK
jgi:tetratricopeptide (TPR) repeat protein